MKIRLTLLSVLLVLIAGCAAPRVTLVPEISPPLIQEDVFVWSGQVAGNMLFTCGEDIGWVDAAGKIVAWDPEKKIATEIFAVPFTITTPPFYQGNLLVLRDKTSDRLLVYDLNTRTVRFEALHMGVDHILGVDEDCMVYLADGGLTVNFWRQPGAVFRAAAGAAPFFNCHFSPERILILTPEILYTFWKKSGKFDRKHLPQPALSPFVFDGGYIYYGSSERFLVKFSPDTDRLVWKLKLGQNLERQPFISGGSIMISPADNNVMRVNGNGSVRWWLGLDSILQFNLVPMTDHLAAFLLNQEIKFIEPRRRQETVFKINGRPAGMPLAYKHDLYFFLAAGETQKLQRVGNQYGIDVKLAPEHALWLGGPIVFSIQTINLLNPRLLAVIRDEAGETVLTKTTEIGTSAALVWIPPQAGVYRLHMSAMALNRNEEKDISFQVFDPQKFIPEFHFHF